MSHHRRRRPTYRTLIVALAMASACEDDAGPPEARVTALEVVAGDQQEALAATTLAQPLVARAVDARGRPVRAARVEWLAPEGAGTVTPLAERTDAEGVARATWTLGQTAGGQSAQVRVGTITAAFTATARAGAAASVAVSPAAVMLDAIGATAEVDAIARDVFDNVIQDRTPAWSTTDAAVFTVDDDGTVTAVAPGSARVRAVLDGVTGEGEVTVQPQPAAIVIDPPAAQLSAIGATTQFTAAARDRNGHPVSVPASQFVWSSSDEQIVSVSPAGLATARAVGSASVRAALGTVVGEAQVVVQQAPVSLEISPAADTLTTPEPTAQLTVTGTDASGAPIPAPVVTWSTSNAAIAIVSQTGLVTAVANGLAYIRAINGAARDSATITVRLNSAPKAVADELGALTDTPREFAAPGVLTNDTVGIPPATVASFGGGSVGGTVASYAAGTTATFGTGGSLRVNADGSIAFTPSAGFTGSFTFQYRAQNVAGSTEAAVTIHVGAAPTAAGDAYMTASGTTLSVAAPGIRLNDDPGSQPAAVTSFGGAALAGTVTTFAAGQTVAFGVGGFLRVNADGSVAFTPPAGFTGDFVFQYRLSSGIGSSDATVTITVTTPPLEPSP